MHVLHIKTCHRYCCHCYIPFCPICNMKRTKQLLASKGATECFMTSGQSSDIGGESSITMARSGGSVSLNHVLELLVAAQREILDTQRELIHAAEIGRDDEPHKGSRFHQQDTSHTFQHDECSLIQRYQENSLGLLNAAAEGLVQVIMSWKPTLQGPKWAAHPATSSLLGPVEGTISYRSQERGVSASQVIAGGFTGSMLVATLAEVECFEAKIASESEKRRGFQTLFHWLLGHCRRIVVEKKEQERERAVRIKEVEELSRVVQQRSKALLQHQDSLKQIAVTALTNGNHRAVAGRYFSRWMMYLHIRRLESHGHELAAHAAIQHEKSTKTFEAFSLWHRAKLCRRIEALETELVCEKAVASQRQNQLEAMLDGESNTMRTELDRALATVRVFSEQLSTLEQDLAHANTTIAELTHELTVSQQQHRAALQAQQMSAQHSENNFFETLRQNEADHQIALYASQRDTLAMREFLCKHVYSSLDERLDAMLASWDVHHTLQSSIIVESIQGIARRPESHALSESKRPLSSSSSTSDTTSSCSAALDSTSSTGGSVDRSELMLKLTQLTQEIETLRMERTVRDQSVASITSTLALPGSPRLWLRSPVRDTGSSIALSSLLRSKTKCILAGSCFRKWSLHATGNQCRRKMVALEKERRDWLQHSIEERDRALVALDEQVEDEHIRMSQRASLPRTSLVGEFSPSPLRATLLSAASNQSFDGLDCAAPPHVAPVSSHHVGGGSSPLMPISGGNRRWSVGYRSSPISSVVRQPLELFLHSNAGEPMSPQGRGRKVSHDVCTSTADDGVTVCRNASIDLTSLENEELHGALTASHEREKGLMDKLESVVSELEVQKQRVEQGNMNASATEERLVAMYMELLQRDCAHDEESQRSDITHNELRARLHLHRIVANLKSAMAEKTHERALSATRINERVSEALASAADTHLLIRSWSCWNEFLVFRRSEFLITAERESASLKLRSLQDKYEAQIKELTLRMDRQHHDSAAKLQIALENNDHLLAERVVLREKVKLEDSEKQEQMNELRTDLKLYQLLSSRLGSEVVIYCGSATLSKWRAYASQRRLAREQRDCRRSRGVTFDLGRQLHVTAEDYAKLIFSKWSLYHVSIKASLERKLSDAHHRIEELSLKQLEHEDELRQKEQQLASLHLQITDVMKPRIGELERALSERDGVQQTAQRQIEIAYEANLRLQKDAFQREKQLLEDDHRQYCDELRESEALRHQELLEQQRSRELEHNAQIDALSHQFVISAGEALLSEYSLSCATMHELWRDAFGLICALHTLRRAWDDVSGAMELDLLTTDEAVVNKSAAKEAFLMLCSRCDILQNRLMNSEREVVALETHKALAHLEHTATQEMLEAALEYQNLVKSARLDLLRSGAKIQQIEHEQERERHSEVTEFCRFLEENVETLQRKIAQKEQDWLADRNESSKSQSALHSEILSLQNTVLMISNDNKTSITRMTSESAHWQKLYDELLSRHQVLQQTISQANEDHSSKLQEVEDKHRKHIAELRQEFELERADFTSKSAIARTEEVTRALQAAEQDFIQKIETLHVRLQHQHDAVMQRETKALQESFRLRLDSVVEDSTLRSSSQLQELSAAHRIAIEMLEQTHRDAINELRNDTTAQNTHEAVAAVESRLREQAVIHEAQIKELMEQNRSLLSGNEKQTKEQMETICWEYENVKRESWISEAVTIEHARTAQAERGLSDWMSQQIVSFEDIHRLTLTQTERIVRAALRRSCVDAREEVANRNELCKTVTVLEARFQENASLLLSERNAKKALEESLRRQTETELPRALQEAFLDKESQIQDVTTMLIDESKAAIATIAAEHQMQINAMQKKCNSRLASVLANSNSFATLCRWFYQWQRESLIRAFRHDYKDLRCARDQLHAENERLSVALAKSLEENRKVFTRQFFEKTPDAASPGQTEVSPLSEESNSAKRPSINHTLPQTTAAVTPLRSHVAAAMVNFSARVNDSVARSEAAVVSVDSLVAEVEDLIRKGQQLKSMSHTMEQSGSRHTSTLEKNQDQHRVETF